MIETTTKPAPADIPIPAEKPSPAEKPPAAEKLSPVEKTKSESNYLRGTIAQEMVDGTTCYDKETCNVLKFHGTYQQDDRDRRDEARTVGAPDGKFYSFMVRSAIPGGRITSEQLLAELDLCDEIGNTTLRITTRQGLQLHGVLKQNLKQAIRRINEVQLSTIAACGDVSRNIMCSPCPYNGDPVYTEMQNMADRLLKLLRPKTTAYHELWLTDDATGATQRVDPAAGNGPAASNGTGSSNGASHEVEPLYGPTYLPRKFKFAIGLPGDNSADIYANDLGLLAITENFQIVGYNVLVGGSFGLTPSAAKTFAAVAQPMCFVTPDRVIDVAEAVVKVQRDFGNRCDRKIARMKYLIHDWGLERFKDKVEEYFGGDLAPPRPVKITGHNDGMGWQDQGDGLWFYGLNVENGRIKDEPGMTLKSALREVCTTLKPRMRLTPHQSIIFCDLSLDQKPQLEAIFKRHGVKLTEEYSTIRRWAMACPALPTCGLAITESERALPGFLDELEVELEKLGLQDEVFTLRNTGCPNGCARPYNSDIGLVGKAVGKYTIYLGGRREGDRLNFIYKDSVPHDDVVPTLAAVFRYFQSAREPGEALGDFCFRQGKEQLLANCSAFAN